MSTVAEQLQQLLTASDALSVHANGDLMIDEVSAPALVAEYGSPLFVIAEATIRKNYRRIRAAFTNAWPAPVNVMYAIKANSNLAVRAILYDEGAGGDCFGEGELFATFAGGAEAATIALNGSNKSLDGLRIAVERGITVNIDAKEEISALEGICSNLEKTARVNVRLKPWSEDYKEIETDYFGGPDLAEYVRRVKWGFSTDAAESIIRRLQSSSQLVHSGFSFHIGRVSQGTEFLLVYGRELSRMVVDLKDRTGYVPTVLDIGGGWARERDPESKKLDLNHTPVEDCVNTVCQAILSQLNVAAIPVPQLWVEPGRYIIGNASVLLATVGSIKRDCDRTWINVDASTNDLPRIDTNASAYHVIAANGMLRPADRKVDIVGHICADSVLGRNRLMPEMKHGELIAILDAGMYSESTATQFNSTPRPATLLVNGTSVDLIRIRESVSDVFAHHRIPPRLMSDKTTMHLRC